MHNIYDDTFSITYCSCNIIRVLAKNKQFALNVSDTNSNFSHEHVEKKLQIQLFDNIRLA